MSFEEEFMEEFSKQGVSNKLTHREIDEFNKIHKILTGNKDKFKYIITGKPNKLAFYFQPSTDFVILFNHSTTGVEIKDSTHFIVHDHILEFYNNDYLCIGVYPVELINNLKIL